MWFSEGPEREAGTLSMGKLPICWVILRDHFLLLPSSILLVILPTERMSTWHRKKCFKSEILGKKSHVLK